MSFWSIFSVIVIMAYSIVGMSVTVDYAITRWKNRKGKAPHQVDITLTGNWRIDRTLAGTFILEPKTDTEVQS